MRGRLAECLAPVDCDEFPSIAKRFNYIRTLVNHFWRRLCKELTPTLHLYNKWLSQSDSLRKGDIVVMIDVEGGRVQGKFPIGRIVGTDGGIDGVPRRFMVRTAKGVLERAYNKICLLHRPVGDSELKQIQEVPLEQFVKAKGKSHKMKLRPRKAKAKINLILCGCDI